MIRVLLRGLLINSSKGHHDILRHHGVITIIVNIIVSRQLKKHTFRGLFPTYNANSHMVSHKRYLKKWTDIL